MGVEAQDAVNGRRRGRNVYRELPTRRRTHRDLIANQGNEDTYLFLKELQDGTCFDVNIASPISITFIAPHPFDLSGEEVKLEGLDFSCGWKSLCRYEDGPTEVSND